MTWLSVKFEHLCKVYTRKWLTMRKTECKDDDMKTLCNKFQLEQKAVPQALGAMFMYAHSHVTVSIEKYRNMSQVQMHTLHREERRLNKARECGEDVWSGDEVAHVHLNAGAEPEAGEQNVHQMERPTAHNRHVDTPATPLFATVQDTGSRVHMGSARHRRRRM